MKTLRNVAMILFFLIAALIVTVCCIYNYQLKPVDEKSTEEIVVVIPSGTSTKKIGEILEKEELIKSAQFFYIYCKLYEVNDMKATTYTLTKAMSLEDIVETLRTGNTYNPDQITIRFVEGINFRNIASTINNNTNNKYEDILKLGTDEKYLDELIAKYWFLTDEIKNKDVYYPLEGYLFPDTYKFASKDVTTKEIFTKMLDRTKQILDKYKDDIEKSKYSVREILTLASIIEKEGKTDDFTNISSVFHNRLDVNMKLESCATTFYGMGLDFNETGIANSEMIANINPYNTYKVEKLPIGPISNPGEKAIKAAIYPEQTKNLFFLSDKKGKTYFFETLDAHAKKKKELIAAGNFYR